MENKDLTDLISELLNKDKLDHIGLIRNSVAAKSIEIASEILRSRNIANIFINLDMVRKALNWLKWYFYGAKYIIFEF